MKALLVLAALALIVAAQEGGDFDEGGYDGAYDWGTDDGSTFNGLWTYVIAIIAFLALIGACFEHSSEKANAAKLEKNFTERFNASTELGIDRREAILSQFLVGNWRIEFNQKGSFYSTKSLKIKVLNRSEQSGIYSIIVSSSDSIGRWRGRGYIAINELGTTFWMLKEYEDRKKAGQNGKWRHLIYEGAQVQ